VPPELKIMGKTLKTLVFPASNDFIIIPQFGANATGGIHNFGGKSIFFAGFRPKSI
jgi:hypothetical protein